MRLGTHVSFKQNPPTPDAAEKRGPERSGACQGHLAGRSGHQSRAQTGIYTFPSELQNTISSHIGHLVSLPTRAAGESWAWFLPQIMAAKIRELWSSEGHVDER